MLDKTTVKLGTARWPLILDATAAAHVAAKGRLARLVRIKDGSEKSTSTLGSIGARMAMNRCPHFTLELLRGGPPAQPARFAITEYSRCGRPPRTRCGCPSSRAT